MSKKPTKDQAWTIYRLKATPAVMLGRVYAPDEESAIAKAIEQFEITDREQQKRLIAQRA
jgi:hypothetical protein